METLRHDLRQALRSLGAHPGYTAIVVLVLALGIGPNTAIFSLVNSMLLTPPPYPDPERIVSVTQIRQSPSGPQTVSAIATDDFKRWRATTQTLQALSLFAPGTLTLTGQGAPVRLSGSRVSADLFEVLGTSPFRGRSFEPAEEKPGNDKVIILSHSLWKTRFAGADSLLGKSIKLDGLDYTVIGIMPDGFSFPNSKTQYWVPLALTPGVDEHRVMMVPAIGRLKPGVSVKQAEAEANSLMQRIRQETPEAARTGRGAQLHLVTLQEQAVGPLRPALQALLVAVGFLLLIACANVANLLLARSAGRRLEFSIRAALGASRGRLIRQIITESMLLSLLGGAAGLTIGYWAMRLLPRLSPMDIPRIQDSHIDGRVLAFTLLLSCAAGLIFGLFPALRSSRTSLAETMKGSATLSRAGFQLFRYEKTRSLLTVCEVALALMLLVGAGLLVRSFLVLIRQDPGYDPAGVLTLQISLPAARYPQPEQRITFYDHLVDSLHGLPGARSAGLINLMPMAPADVQMGFRIPGRGATSSREERPVGGVRLVSSGYFSAMAIRVVQGRDFLLTDREGGKPVAIVNEALVRRYFSGRNPLGQQIQLAGRREIMGVVHDTKPQGLDSEPRPDIFLPYRQFGPMLMMGGPLAAMNVVVRTDADPLQLVSAIRTRIAELDPQLPLFNIATLEQRISTSVARPRFYALILAVFALMAVILATVGIYAVLSYQVSSSRREIGIRMALGARRNDVLRMVLRHGILLAAVGTAIGLAGAWAICRFLSSLLFGVTATDPLTYAGLSLLMLMVAALASFIPARRATSVDPAVTLRCE